MNGTKNLYYPDNPIKPFGLIFFVELWERFGWYWMQALLLYFFIKELGDPDDTADHIFGAFSALAYAFLSLGGYVGDKVLGCKRTIIFGAIVLTTGYLVLGINLVKFIFIGLAIIVVGNAIFKPNQSSLVSKLFKPGDHGELMEPLSCTIWQSIWALLCLLTLIIL